MELDDLNIEIYIKVKFKIMDLFDIINPKWSSEFQVTIKVIPSFEFESYAMEK